MKVILIALAGAALMAGPALAQQPPAGGPPGAPGAAPRPAPAPPQISKDPAKAAAGAYKMDTRHASVLARVPHQGGTSYLIFRFNEVQGDLTWDPANAAAMKVSMTVNPASISIPVGTFAQEVAGDRFLKSAQFPTATFVSKSVKKTGSNTAEIQGDFTLMGKTLPMTVNATMVGTGNSIRGVPTLGFNAVGKFKSSDVGLNVGEVEVVFDGEFNKS
jgi:polyisoprenoid-binding protein YceI